jgi:hypothetical protein
MDTASVAERYGEIIPVISFMEKMLTARAQAWTGTVRVFSRWLSVVVFLVLLGLAPPVTPQQNAKNVLVIFSIFDRQQIAYLDLIESPVRAHFNGPVNFYTTYLNPRKLLEKGYRESLAETLRRQYSDVKLDVVVAAAIPAIPFATDYRDRIFPACLSSS